MSWSVPAAAGRLRVVATVHDPAVVGAILAQPRDDAGPRPAGLGLSARAHDRLLRVARTIADLANSDPITAGPAGTVRSTQERRGDLV